MKYLYEDQIIPETIYPVEMEHSERFGDLDLFFRPVKPSDSGCSRSTSQVVGTFRVPAFLPGAPRLPARAGAGDGWPPITTGTWASWERWAHRIGAHRGRRHWMMDYNENIAEVLFCERRQSATGERVPLAALPDARRAGATHSWFRATLLPATWR
jgi:hypothetical protein